MSSVNPERKSIRKTAFLPDLKCVDPVAINAHQLIMINKFL